MLFASKILIKGLALLTPAPQGQPSKSELGRRAVLASVLGGVAGGALVAELTTQRPAAAAVGPFGSYAEGMIELNKLRSKLSQDQAELTNAEAKFAVDRNIAKSAGHVSAEEQEDLKLISELKYKVKDDVKLEKMLLAEVEKE